MITKAERKNVGPNLSVVCVCPATGEVYSLPCERFFERRRKQADAAGPQAATRMAQAVLHSSDLQVAHAMVKLLAEDSARLTALEAAIKHSGHQLDFHLGEFCLTPATRAHARKFATLREAIDHFEAADGLG
nr:hypothetical protein [uncultured Cupriavidus sp.]